MVGDARLLILLPLETRQVAPDNTVVLMLKLSDKHSWSICRPTYRPICQSTYQPTYQLTYLGRYIGRVSVDMSTDISVDMSTDISVKCQSIYRPIHWSRGAQNTHDP